MVIVGNPKVAKPQQKIYFVTGKGGVGKSTVAAATAQRLASEGRRTLLVELGERSYFASLYGMNISFTPQPCVKGPFDIALWDGQSSLREFLLHYVKISKVVDLFFENKIMKSFIKAAPALKELAILGKITSGIRGIGPELDYDAIVVDGFATGHFLALFDVPKGMHEAVNFGPMGEQSKNIDAVIRNPDQVKILITTIAEELPVTEALELNGTLIENYQQRAQIICNRIVSPPVDEDVLIELKEKIPNNEFIKYLVQVLRKQQLSLEKLSAQSEKVWPLPLCLEGEGTQRITRLSGEVQWI